MPMTEACDVARQTEGSPGGSTDQGWENGFHGITVPQESESHDQEGDICNDLKRREMFRMF